MDRKGELTVGSIVIILMAVIAGIVLIEAIFDQQSVMTTKNTITDETYNLTSRGCYGVGQVNGSSACNITVTNAPTGWKVAGCPLTTVVVTNNSGGLLAVNTDYKLYAGSGIVQMLNTTKTTQVEMVGIAKIDYAYCRDGYNKDAGSRSIAGIIGLFAVLALIAFLAGYVLKDKLM